ncbi:GOLPH3/VPS74 family protein [Saccharothrix longispora]|uniref:GOLPH3/VPS74 family protein n=1 Tax=Saccharothrix longispora TaxID=33920 RepID=UPI0028FD2F8B|nr:GPP34 family phosphoprotein [Saccharothrix longispora]MBY8851886.1 GPP34 family phosphoprotein [Saccharothrix sp. MB29]MDU0293884.1 GPP34 family phosphoprotein [Saccharothrix longispora]
MDVTLADELALLVHDDEDGTRRLGQPALGYGLAGALLVELALAGRVDVVDKKVAVVDPAPTGHPLLDGALARIADDKPRKPGHWVDKLSRGLTDRVLDGLVERGVLRREEGRVLLVFPRTRFPAPDGREPDAEADARARMHAAVAGDGPVDPRTAALCALVKAVGQDRKVFADLPRGDVGRRLKAISEGEWAATAVRKAIEEVQAAITVALVVPAASS